MAIDLKSLNYAQLTDLIHRAEQRKTEAGKEHLANVRNKVRALLESDGLTLEEVFGGRYKSVRSAGAKRGKSAAGKPRRAKRGKSSK